MDTVEWSEQAKRLTYGTLKETILSGSTGTSDTVPLHGGLPPDEGLPIQSMTLKLYNGETVEIPMTMGQQQYNVPAIGYEPLRSWCEAHTKRQHGVTADHSNANDTTTMITDSTTHALDAATSVLLNPGDSVLIEEYTVRRRRAHDHVPRITYPSPLTSHCSLLTAHRSPRAHLHPIQYCHFTDCTVERQGYKPLSVPMDEGGITPEGLERVILERIELSKRAEMRSLAHCEPSSVVGNGKQHNGIRCPTPEKSERKTGHKHLIPRVLYIIPTAQNPTGCSYTESRRRAIYAICQRYDIIIIEDDPYHYLQFNLGERINLPDQPVQPGQPGLYDLVSHSFLSMDVDGRVVRLDSFAKFLAPGFRLGWATGPRSIIDKMAMKIHSATLGGNMMCQSIVSNILTHWGDAGLDAYVSRMQGLYANKAAAAISALEAHMKDFATWRTPVGGMFVWIRLLHHKDAREFFQRLKSTGVIVMPGHVSLAEKTDADGNTKFCPHIRISFSYISAEAIADGIRRIADTYRALYPPTSK